MISSPKVGSSLASRLLLAVVSSFEIQRRIYSDEVYVYIDFKNQSNESRRSYDP